MSKAGQALLDDAPAVRSGNTTNIRTPEQLLVI